MDLDFVPIQPTKPLFDALRELDAEPSPPPIQFILDERIPVGVFGLTFGKGVVWNTDL